MSTSIKQKHTPKSNRSAHNTSDLISAELVLGSGKVPISCDTHRQLEISDQIALVVTVDGKPIPLVVTADGKLILLVVTADGKLIPLAVSGEWDLMLG